MNKKNSILACRRCRNMNLHSNRINNFRKSAFNLTTDHVMNMGYQSSYQSLSCIPSGLSGFRLPPESPLSAGLTAFRKYIFWMCQIPKVSNVNRRAMTDFALVLAKDKKKTHYKLRLTFIIRFDGKYSCWVVFPVIKTSFPSFPQRIIRFFFSFCAHQRTEYFWTTKKNIKKRGIKKDHIVREHEPKTIHPMKIS